MAVKKETLGKISSSKKIGFMFGAGAEQTCFHLPLGSEYTQKTLLLKRSKLYDALKMFYDKRKVDNYFNEYDREFLFHKKSITFGEIIARALRECNNKAEKVDPATQALLDLFKKDEHGKIKLGHYDELTGKEEELVKERVQNCVYPEIVLDENEGGNTDNEDTTKSSNQDNPYSSLKKYLSYYGSVEKDFACIIDPHRAGIKKFCRLINYFWSAYFSLVLPLLDGSPKYKQDENYVSSKYEYVLSNLKEVTDHIYGESFRDSFSGQENNYYSAIKESKFPVDYILTTNYTPFCLQTGLDREEISFLAGELCLFEKPHQFSVVNLCEEMLSDNEFIFPYLLTQAPVKPIVEPRQIKEYAKAVNFLEAKNNILVIIGYSLSENDNHINSLLREFIVGGEKHLVYCCYSDDDEKLTNDRQQTERNNLLQKLKLCEEDVHGKVDVIFHTGDVRDVLSRVKAQIQEIQGK